MFDTIAEMLRGSAPDDLAHALGTDRTQTRRAMEIGLPALITGLRDKTLEPGGAQNLASMLDDPGAAVPSDLNAYLTAGDPAQGAAMLDVAFGDRGEPALTALSSASGLSTRLLAQVMSVLAPLATGTVAVVAERSPDGLRSYLADAVADLEGKGFGRVVELVSPAGLDLGLDAVQPEPVDLLDVVDLVDAPGDGEVVLDLDDDPDGDDDVAVATVVAGAFPESADDLVVLDDLVPASLDSLDLLDDPTEAHEMADVMPDFDLEVANVAPAGVPIFAGAAAAGATMTITEPAPVEAHVQSNAIELEGKSLSSMGWLWWVIGAVLGIVILLFAITQCGGSDGAGGVATNGDATATPIEDTTPDPVVVERQLALDAILVAYPGVQGEVFGDVAVLNGTVEDDTARATLDQAVRDAGLGVQNNVSASAAPIAGEDGYSLNDQIDVQPELSTLKALLAQAGLEDALDGGGEFTLFAPTNDAFAAISDQLAALQDDPVALQEVLRYHLLVGAQDAAALGAAGTVATQLEGQSITVDASSGSLILNGSVPVLATAAPARNGVMHIIGSVLLPNTASVLPEEIGAELGLTPITFALGSSDLTDAGKVEVDKVVAFLLTTPGNIEIGGHTDADGDTALNQSLSQDRANAVKDYMAAQGIPAESMTAVGFGEDQPIAPNDTSENKAKNRRIEFRPI